MAFVFPTSGLTNGQVFVTPSGIAYTYNSTTNAWAPGFTRSQLVNQSFTATAGQTVFTVLGGYSPGIVDIYYRGSKLPASDFTATNGTSFTLVNQCEAGDDVQIRSFAQFTLANMVQKNSTAGDTMDNVVIGSKTPAAASFTQTTTGPISGATSINGGQLAGFRNKIINGAFGIDQRLEGTNVATSGSFYGVDRWLYQASQASKYYVQQTAAFNSASYGVPFNTGIAITTPSTAYTPASGDYFQIQQPIEAINTADLMWGTPYAKPVTFSFYCVCSVSGTFAGRISSGGNNNNYSYVFTFPVTGNTSLISVTVPGCTLGTPYTGAGIASMTVCFDFGGGSARQTSTPNTWVSGDFSTTASAAKLVSIANATMYITGVQLELGTKSTPFEFRSYGTELALCQRYFEKSYSTGTKPGTNTNTGAVSNSYINYQTSSKFTSMISVHYKATKCSSPTITHYSGDGTSGTVLDNINSQDISATTQFSGLSGHTVVATMATANTAIWYIYQWTAQSEL